MQEELEKKEKENRSKKRDLQKKESQETLKKKKDRKHTVERGPRIGTNCTGLATQSAGPMLT